MWLTAAATMKLIVPGILAVGVGLGTVTSAAVKASVAFRALNAATGWIRPLAPLAATFLLLGKEHGRSYRGTDPFSEQKQPTD